MAIALVLTGHALAQDELRPNPEALKLETNTDARDLTSDLPDIDAPNPGGLPGSVQPPGVPGTVSPDTVMRRELGISETSPTTSPGDISALDPSGLVSQGGQTPPPNDSPIPDSEWTAEPSATGWKYRHKDCAPPDCGGSGVILEGVNGQGENVFYFMTEGVAARWRKENSDSWDTVFKDNKDAENLATEIDERNGLLPNPAAIKAAEEDDFYNSVRRPARATTEQPENISDNIDDWLSSDKDKKPASSSNNSGSRTIQPDIGSGDGSEEARRKLREDCTLMNDPACSESPLTPPVISSDELAFEPKPYETQSRPSDDDVIYNGEMINPPGSALTAPGLEGCDPAVEGDTRCAGFQDADSADRLRRKVENGPDDTN
tara:strand:- start:2000 stop:3127 length:1128 start_codon:yes stop_codon:yes gene_type:complete